MALGRLLHQIPALQFRASPPPPPHSLCQPHYLTTQLKAQCVCVCVCLCVSVCVCVSKKHRERKKETLCVWVVEWVNCGFVERVCVCVCVYVWCITLLCPVSMSPANPAVCLC